MRLMNVPACSGASAADRSFFAVDEERHPTAQVSGVLGALRVTASRGSGRRRMGVARPPLRACDCSTAGYGLTTEVEA